MHWTSWISWLAPVMVVVAFTFFFDYIKPKKNATDPVCTKCETAPPFPRKPANSREFWLGGWTCAVCLTTLDARGKPLPGVTGRPPSKPLSASAEGRAYARRIPWITGFVTSLIIFAIMTGFPIIAKWRVFDLGRLAIDFLIWFVVGGLVISGLAGWLLSTWKRDSKSDDPSQHY